MRLTFALTGLASVKLGSGLILLLSGRWPFLVGFRPFLGFLPSILLLSFLPLLFAVSFAASFLVSWAHLLVLVA